MAIELDLKQHIKTYGQHTIKVIATGEGFRNSEPVENTYNNLPYIQYTDDGLLVSNVQPGVIAFDLYVDNVLQKTVSHDVTLTDDVLIDLSDTSADPDDVNYFKVVAHTSYGDFDSNETKTTMVFGVSGMYDESVELTRTDDAVNMTYSIDTTTGIVTSDFDNEFPYNEMTEVTIDDNVFISIPEMWWRIGKDESGNITDIAVSKLRKGSGSWYKSDAFLVGKYMSYLENNKMVSKSGKAMTQNYSILNWTSYATANGDGYKPYATYEHTILTFLWLIEFANKRSSNIMTGYASYNLATGTTDSIDSPTGYVTSNNRMKYRGIEDFVGNDLLWFPDVTAGYYTSRDVTTYVAGTTNKTQLSYFSNITTSNNWRGIQALGWDDNHPFICIPSKLGGTSGTTYFGTSMYGPNGNSSYLARGKTYPNYNTYCSLSTLVFDVSYSNAQDNTTSRLIKYEN